jgi:putative flippase GtrA
VIMYIGNSWLLFNYILVQIFGTAIVVIITFILNALWTFAESEE